MYAIAFDMLIAQLVKNYGEPYNNAYYEIKQVLSDYDFINLQGSVYLTTNPSLANLYNAIQGLTRKSLCFRHRLDHQLSATVQNKPFTTPKNSFYLYSYINIKFSLGFCATKFSTVAL